jgi:hypothetical protein
MSRVNVQPAALIIAIATSGRGRTLSSHNPTTFKDRSIGQHEINGTPLPAKGFF